MVPLFKFTFFPLVAETYDGLSEVAGERGNFNLGIAAFEHPNLKSLGLYLSKAPAMNMA